MSVQNPLYWIGRAAVVARARELCGYSSETHGWKNVILGSSDALIPGDDLYVRTNLGMVVCGRTAPASLSVNFFNSLNATYSWSKMAGSLPSEPAETVLARGNTALVLQPAINRVDGFSAVRPSANPLTLAADTEAPRGHVHTNVGVVLQPGKSLLYGYSAHCGWWRSMKGDAGAADVAVGANVALVSAEFPAAFSAITGVWSSLAPTTSIPGHVGASSRTTAATPTRCWAGTNVAVVAYGSRGAVHAYSALKGTWSTSPTPLQEGDVVEAAGNVALVARPSQRTVYGYSAVTGAWAAVSFAAEPDSPALEWRTGTNALRTA